MLVVHRGAGMLVILYGILAALIMNILTVKLFEGDYYQQNRWPKLMVLVLAGVGCFITGRLLNKKRGRETSKEKEHINSLSPKFSALKDFAYGGARDHLMYIPLTYWSIVYFAAALVYIVVSA